jgi:hypothetical protein
MMLWNVANTAASAAFTALLFLTSAPANAAPIGEGACCHLTFGCCDAPVELQGDVEGGGGPGQCRISSQAACNGIQDSYQGDGTTCEQFCALATTTTTLPEIGACCHNFNGCCGGVIELKGGAMPRGAVGGGECRDVTSAECNGIADTFKGNGTTCLEECPIVTTTTLPSGACCQPAGTCLDVIEANCVVGDYQGDGTDCATVECSQPTTTTTPEPTTTTEYLPTTTVLETTTTTEPLVVLCGDANADGEVSSVDALIALRTSVGTSSCPETRCDYNGSGDVQTSDALAILRVSVGQVVVPMCPLI